RTIRNFDVGFSVLLHPNSLISKLNSFSFQPEFAISLRLKVSLIGAGANPNLTTVAESTWHEKHLYSMREPRSENQLERTAVGDFREKLVNMRGLAPGDVLLVRYRLVCDANFYGRTCKRFCRASKGVHGNFFCNPLTGEKICLKGWSGEYCTKAVILVGTAVIATSAGFIRVAYTEAAHGIKRLTYSSPSPANVILDGVECFATLVTLDYCKTHPDICRNHGQCVNTRDPSELFYRCLCKPGFRGKNCEIMIPSCATRGCNHAGTCVKQNDLSVSSTDQ
ncbi:hypothetical protein P879_06131, partial [Paragonimus westermani]